MANNKELTQSSVKIRPTNDFSALDAQFIMQYANKDSSILDLGSGTGLIINKIYKNVQEIFAIEPFSQFTDFIESSSNIHVINENILLYSTQQYFDYITLFGIIQYFSKEEAIQIYKRYKNNLKPTGKLLIKNQFGVKENICINGFSKELQKNYYSNYRHIDEEVQLLKDADYKNINIIDIYPEECNRWKILIFML